MHTLSYAIKFWSNGTKQAYFLRHEGYLGSIGAFLRHQPTDWIRRFSVSRRDSVLSFLLARVDVAGTMGTNGDENEVVDESKD